MNDTPDTEVPVQEVIASLQRQVADQALRIAILEARLSAPNNGAVVVDHG